MAVLGAAISFYGDTCSFQEPYFNATTRALDPTVPGLLPISIAGFGFLAETSFTPFKQDAYRSDSIQAIADRADWSNIPGESSVGAEGLWRRRMQDWSRGAGQEYLDRGTSVPNRFFTSKGIYPWQQNKATLLNDTVAVHTSGAELQVLAVGNVVYINDNGTVRFSSDLSTWTVVAGVTATTTTNALATDGFNIYVATGTLGVYIAQIATDAAFSYVTGSVNYVWYAGGLLMAAGPNSGDATSGNALYNITTETPKWPTTPVPVALPSPLLIHPIPQFVWDCCAAGASWVYVAGRTSNTGANISTIYKTQMNTTGTAMTVPVVAATLPGGELVFCLYAYANFILVGTSLGARFCQTLGVNDPGGSAGDLKLGPIVPDQIQQVSKPVKCFTGQFRFIWFGWSNYDAVSTGLGRMDLSTFIDQQSPAYTSDLMVTTTGEVVSMDWYNGLNNIAGVTNGAPIFIVHGQGVFTAASTYVSNGTIDTGLITYGLPDDKILRLINFEVSGSAGSIAAAITIGNSTYHVPSQLVTNDLEELLLPTSLKDEEFDVQIQLNAGEVNTVSPILRGFTVKALECVVTGTIHKAIVNVFSDVETNSVDMCFDPYATYAFLDGLRKNKDVIVYWEGRSCLGLCVVDSLTRLPYSERGPAGGGGFNQRFEVSMKTVDA